MCSEIASCKDLTNANYDPLFDSPMDAIHMYSVNLIATYVFTHLPHGMLKLRTPWHKVVGWSFFFRSIGDKYWGSEKLSVL